MIFLIFLARSMMLSSECVKAFSMLDLEPPSELLHAIEKLLHERGYSHGRLCKGLEQLSALFESPRPTVRNYLRNPDLLAAYVAYYLPLNSLKVAWILDEMTRYAQELLEKELRVLDFGSGPGTALLALWEISPRRHRAVAVDRAPEALHVAERLLQDSTEMALRFQRKLSRGPFDLIFASNVYVELDSDRTIEELLDLLDPTGYLVIVEPALKETTQRLMALRDKLASSGWTIAAPCLEVAQCPMRTHAELWCHMSLSWRRPSWIQRLEDKVGRLKKPLKFSYLVVTRGGGRLKGTARLVSNLHEERGGFWGYLCGSGAELCRCELLRRDLGPGNRPFRAARRGDLLEIPGYEARPQQRLSADSDVRLSAVARPISSRGAGGARRAEAEKI